MNTEPNPSAFPLSDEKFQGFVRGHHKFIIGHPLGESLMPELIVVTRSPEGDDELTMCALAVPFNEDHEKRGILHNLGKRFWSEKKVVAAVILVSEAWLSVRPKDSKAPHVEPRHDPNRKENIIVLGSGLIGTQRLLIATPVRRDAENNMVIDGEPQEMPGAHFPLVEWFWRGFFEEVRAKGNE